MKSLNMSIGIIFTFCLTLYLSMLLLIQFDILIIAVTSTVLVTVFGVLFDKSRGKKVLVVYGAVLAMFLLFALWNRWFELASDFVKDYNSWISAYLNGYENYDSYYGSFTVYVLLVAFSLFFSMFAYARRNLPLVMFVCLAIIAIPNNLPQNVYYVMAYAMLFLAMTLFFMNHVYIQRIKNGAINGQSKVIYMVRGIILSTIIFAISWISPFSERPAYFINENVTLQNIQPWIADFGYGGYSFNNRGLRDKLGGPISSDTETMLMVESEVPVYLYGALYDEYTGQNWYISDKSTEGYSNNDSIFKKDLYTKTLVDTVYSLYFLNDYFKRELFEPVMQNEKNESVGKASSVYLAYYASGLDFVRDLFWKDSDELNAFKSYEMNIEYATIRTKSIFVPIKMQLIDINLSNDNLIQSKEGIILINNYNGRIFNYSVSAYEVKRRSEAFEKTLRFLSADFETAYQIAIDSSNVFAKTNFDYDGYSNYAKEIKDKYIILPETVPVRVKELAEEITIDCNNDYDKAKAIENYLSKNYKYRLDMPFLQAESDFVDDFLFEQKEGYCTYFASAMTVMLRSIGVPARYAEGFMMKNSTYKNGVYYVTNEQAHAWTDVFIPGYGWLQFEPTSSYNSSFYATNVAPVSAGGSGSGGNGGLSSRMPNFPQMPEYLLQEQMPVPSMAGNVYKTNEKNSSVALFVKMVNIFATAVALVVFAFIVNLIRIYLLYYLDLRNKNNRVVVKRFYLRILKLLKIYKIELYDDETVTAFSNRIKKLYPVCVFDMKTVTEIYEKARYGNADEGMDNSDKEYIINQFKLLTTGIKRDINSNKAFVERYVKGSLL